jgi:hypothetical protein
MLTESDELDCHSTSKRAPARSPGATRRAGDAEGVPLGRRRRRTSCLKAAVGKHQCAVDLPVELHLQFCA